VILISIMPPGDFSARFAKEERRRAVSKRMEADPHFKARRGYRPPMRRDVMMAVLGLNG